MRLPEGQRSADWVARLPAVVSALNNEVTQLTGKKPAKAITEKTVSAKPSTPYLRSVGVNEKKLPSGVSVCYLYQHGELEGGRRRATDPIWGPFLKTPDNFPGLKTILGAQYSPRAIHF